LIRYACEGLRLSRPGCIKEYFLIIDSLASSDSLEEIKEFYNGEVHEFSNYNLKFLH
jgi:hypothetical protein